MLFLSSNRFIISCVGVVGCGEDVYLTSPGRQTDIGLQLGKARYKRIGYSLDIMRQTACLVTNRIIVDGCALLFNCTTAVRASD